MRESTIERYLVKQVKKRGGIAYKWVSPGNKGVPDRIVIFPGGWIALIELKAPGKTLSLVQRQQRARLNELGCGVRVIDSKQKVDEFLSCK